MRILLTFFLVLFPLLSQADNIYRWTDENGNVYFSDKPHKGAEKLPMPKEENKNNPSQDHTPEVMNIMPQFSEEPLADQTQARSGVLGEYNLVAIVKPQQNENVHGATLDILVDVKPSLFTGDSLELYLDGHKVASSKGSFNFTLHHVDRGTHTLTVKVTNAQGEVVASSEATMVHVHRPFIRKVSNKTTFAMTIKNFFGITHKT